MAPWVARWVSTMALFSSGWKVPCEILRNPFGGQQEILVIAGTNFGK